MFGSRLKQGQDRVMQGWYQGRGPCLRLNRTGILLTKNAGCGVLVGRACTMRSTTGYTVLTVADVPAVGACHVRLSRA